jgi:hypothetical protein
MLHATYMTPATCTCYLFVVPPVQRVQPRPVYTTGYRAQLQLPPVPDKVVLLYTVPQQ